MNFWPAMIIVLAMVLITGVLAYLADRRKKRRKLLADKWLEALKDISYQFKFVTPRTTPISDAKEISPMDVTLTAPVKEKSAP